MANFVVTIDGPAASGKSTVARLLAGRLGASFLDTGAMYRAVTLAAMRAGVDMSDEDELLGVIEKGRFQFSSEGDRMAVSIDGIDVTEQIRSPEVTANARYAASAPRVRAKLVEMQRQFAADRQRIVAEGRDQGTVVFADADMKFYLTAEAKERARRRQAELEAEGKRQDAERVRRAIEERDKSDEGREVGPLRPASDAIIVDTTQLGVEEVVEKLLRCVEEKCSKKG
jgi:cytidylate kinase